MREADVALDEVKRATDEELVTGLKHLVRADQGLNARLLVHLGEVDARGLYREQAYSSMFVYCVEELRMFEAQAYLRIHAARLGRRFPLALELLAEGALTLTAIKLLGPHLTVENHAEVLERASGKRKRDIELLVAEIAPKADVPSRTRKLPEPRAPRVVRPDLQSDSETRQRGIAFEVVVTPPNAGTARRMDGTEPEETTSAICESRALVSPEGLTAAPCLDANVQLGRTCVIGRATSDAMTAASSHASTRPSREASDALLQRECDSKCAEFALDAPRPRGSSKPLSPGRYKVEFTAGQALHDKLEQLQDLLRHQVPDGNLAAIVERAVDLLIDETMKQRFAQNRAAKKTPAEKSGSAKSGSAKSGSAKSRSAKSGSAKSGSAKSRSAKSGSAKSRSAKSGSAKSGSAKSRYIPRAVVREDHARDAGQCTFVSADGKRCSERGFLELHHHDRPFARGGEATAENLRLVCRAHNNLFAEHDYGRAFMREKRRQAQVAWGELGS